MKYEFTSDLVTGNQLIDSEHRHLLDTINDLMDACGQGKGREKSMEVFRYLLSYVNKHFADEEKLQARANYPEFAAHKQFHDNYKKTLEGMSQSLLTDGPTVKTLGALNQQVAVLVSHIRMMDKKMAKYLREHS